MKHLIFILIILITTSCSKIIEIDIPEKDKQVVVNCLLTPDSTLNVELTKSLYIFENNTDFINNATVELYENNIFVENLTYKDSGNYYSPNINPMENNIYEIRISTPDFTNILAIDTIPEKVLINSILTTDYIGTNQFGQSFAELTVDITDPSNTDNYYEIFLMCRYVVDYPVNNTVITTGVRWFSNDIAITEENGTTDNNTNKYGSFIFSDKYFKGQNYDLKVNYLPETGTEDYKLFVILNTVSKQYYDFKKKLMLYRNARNNEFWGINEPVFVSGNINNGLGIFAGYSTNIDSLNWEY